MIDRYFKLAENHTSVKQEMLGGLTTFVTMAYIIVVNPQILAQAGMPPEGVVFATCVSAAVATLVMGLYANYPIALAPGMSLNAYFTYSVCLAMHVPWRTALAVVFLFRRAFPGAHRDAGSRTDCQRHARLPEALDRCGHWNVHCFCWIAQRQVRGRQSGNICWPRAALPTKRCRRHALDWS